MGSSDTASVSFWMYGDPGYSTSYDSIGVYVNTSQSLIGATPLGNIRRYNATANWYYYSFNLPRSYAGSVNHIIFKGVGWGGNNMYLDDVNINYFPSTMSYASSTTTQNTIPLVVNSTNNQIIGIQVATNGSLNPFSITQMKLTTTGSTNPATDLRNAKIFYTGNTPAFSTATQYGTTVTNPVGTFYMTGSQVLAAGTNYFWLTYDITPGATQNDFVDATCDSIVGTSPMGAVQPVPPNPPGARQIRGPMSGQYIVGLGQTSPNFLTITEALANLNSRGISGPVTFLVKPGVYGTDAGLEIDSTFTIPAVTGASAVNTVIIKRKSDEAGLVWVERRGTAGAADFIFNLNGASYITFDSINVRQKDTASAYNGVEYGYYIIPSSPTMGSQYNTIRNCNISLNKSNITTKGIYQFINALIPTLASGSNSYNRYYNNNISNIFSGIYLNGYSSAFPYNLYDHNNQLGVNGGNTITDWGGGASPYGIYASNQDGLILANNTIIQSSTLSTSVYAIQLGTGTGSNVDVYNNTITFTAVGGTAAYGLYNMMGSTALGNHVNIYNNRFVNWPLGSWAGGATMIYQSATADTVNIYNNYIGNDSIGGNGSFYGIYQTAGANNVNIYGDTIINIYRSGNGGVYGINCFATSSFGIEKIYNNVITNVGITPPSTIPSLYLLYTTSTPLNRYIYGNNINNCFTTGSTVYGIYQTGAVNSFVYNNNVNNLTSNNASAAVYGIYNTSGTFNYIYNNFISNLKTPVSNSLTSAYGLYIGSPVTYLGAFHNSIYLNSTSTGAAFGNIGVYVTSSTTNTIDLRNNNIVNTSIPGATTGRTVGIRYSSAAYTNYFAGSGANNIYIGPIFRNSFFFDGTNFDSALNKFQDRVSPREQSSVSENPAFVNAAAGDLHMTGASLLKQGGYAVSSVPSGPAFSVTTDIDGTTRNAAFPDIGADEFTGTRIAGTAPNIFYATLGSGNTANRMLSNVSILDPEGVNNTNNLTKPRVYFKKSTQANIFNDNTSATDGWKYDTTTSAGSPYSFTINYSHLLGGSVSFNDTIVYFVVAQDLAGIPNVGINAGAFSLLPASVNLTAAAFPVTGNVNKYLIAGSLSAEISVGAGQTYTSLTGAAPNGLFAAMN